MQKHGWTNLEFWMPTNQSTILANFPIISLFRFQFFFLCFFYPIFWYLIYCNLLLFAYDPSMKEGCLFVLFVTLKLLKPWCFSSHPLYHWKESPQWDNGALNWCHNVSTYDGEAIEYWTSFSLKICLNQNKKIIEEFECVFGIDGKPIMSRV
jgi:hypothetical protein